MSVGAPEIWKSNGRLCIKVNQLRSLTSYGNIVRLTVGSIDACMELCIGALSGGWSKFQLGIEDVAVSGDV